MAARRQRTLLAAGSRAPDFRLPRLEGGESGLSDLIATGPAVLTFYKVSCPVCQFTLPVLDRIHSPSRLPIYAISQDDAEDSAEFNHQYSVALPTLMDDEDGGFPVSNA